MASRSNTFYGTVSGSSYGFTVAPERNDERPKTPAGLIATQAVQTKDGWLGQVIVDKQIVWESDEHEEGEDAVQAANGRVVQVLKALFSDETEGTG